MLRLVTLGRVQLARDGPPREPIPVQPKRLVLLAYLALAASDGFQRRDTLLALLWPKFSQPQARRCLRQALFHLRNALGDGVLVNQGGEGIALAAGRLWCDAVVVNAALGAGQGRGALALYGGDFLPGVYADDCSAELEEWIQRTRQRLRVGVAAAAWDLVDEEVSQGRTAPALETAILARSLAPDDERGLRRHLVVLDRVGDRAAALETYTEFARRLRREFDAQPSEESRRLAETLRRGDRPGDSPLRPDAASGAETPGARPSGELVGPALSPRRPRIATWTGRIALCGSFLVGGIGYGVSRLHEPDAAPGGHLVLDQFVNRTNDSLLGGAVTEALHADLAQVMEVRLDHGAAAPADSPVGVVTGSIARLGTGFSLTAQLVSPRSGRVLAVVREEASDSTRLLQSVDRLSRRLRRRLADSLRQPSALGVEERRRSPRWARVWEHGLAR